MAGRKTSGYRADAMARPKGKTPRRVIVNARIRPELLTELTAETKLGNPTRSQAIEQAIIDWLERRREAKKTAR